MKFDLIIYGKRTRHLDEVANGVLGRIVHNFSSNVQHIKNIDFWHHNLEDSALILFKNGSSFANFNLNAQLTNSSPKVMKLIIYVENYIGIKNVKFAAFYDSDASHVSSFEYTVVNQKDLIKLITFDNFLEHQCNKFNLKLINSFNKTTQKWTKKLQNHQSFLNFNGCMLTLTSQHDVNFHLSDYNYDIIQCVKTKLDFNACTKYFQDILDQPNVNFKGLYFEIFEIMSKISNFMERLLSQNIKTILNLNTVGAA